MYEGLWEVPAWTRSFALCALAFSVGMGGVGANTVIVNVIARVSLSKNVAHYSELRAWTKSFGHWGRLVLLWDSWTVSSPLASSDVSAFSTFTSAFFRGDTGSFLVCRSQVQADARFYWAHTRALLMRLVYSPFESSQRSNRTRLSRLILFWAPRPSRCRLACGKPSSGFSARFLRPVSRLILDQNSLSVRCWPDVVQQLRQRGLGAISISSRASRSDDTFEAPSCSDGGH